MPNTNQLTNTETETKSNTIRQMIALKPKYDAAKAAALAARCPEEDCLGGGSEPVTTTGWYAVLTGSGRPAWRHYMWRQGRLHSGACTYDLDAESRYGELALQYGELDWLADQDTELSQEARSRGLAL